jgi:hypothetical protein
MEACKEGWVVVRNRDEFGVGFDGAVDERTQLLVRVL